MSVFWYLVVFIAVCHFDFVLGSITSQQKSSQSAEQKSTPVRAAAQREPDTGESKPCKEENLKHEGILGKSLVLYHLRQIKPDYVTINLKYIQNQSKKILLVYNLKTPKEDDRPSKYEFSEENKTITIHKLQKDDERDYELVVVKENRDEEFCTTKIKVYEQITNVTVSATENPQNDTCKVTMRCLMQTGEDVTFSWMEDDKNLSHNSSTLEISITNDNANSTFTCTAKNSVSEQSSTHTLSSACNPEKDNSNHDIIIYILVSTFSGVIMIVILVTVAIKMRRNKGMYTDRYITPPHSPQSRPPPPEPISEQTHEEIVSVYATVQKYENSRTLSEESKSLPFSSVYELAGPCPAYPRFQNNEEIRTCK